MMSEPFRLDYLGCRALLAERLREPPPGRIQLLAGPRQVGKTTLLTEFADERPTEAIYAAADSPEAALPGFVDRLFLRAEEVAASKGRAVVFLDEVHLLHDWAARLKGVWDRLRRRRLPIHLVASGSSALHLAQGSRESLAGRFERLTLTHWSAGSLSRVFGIDPTDAATCIVRLGGYPGAFPFRGDLRRWAAYVRDAILEPAIGRDLLALAAVRRPALLRQVFAIAASSPAQILSLQKIQGQLQDSGAIETVAHYLSLLEEAFLVAPLRKFAASETRRRNAPPKLLTLNNALLAVMDPAGPPDPRGSPARFGAWLENACLAHAWSSGQRVEYWREEPLEVDAVLEGSWGRWALEVKTGHFSPAELRGLTEFVRRHQEFRPLVICDEAGARSAELAGVPWVDWTSFLLHGPSGTPPGVRRAGRRGPR